MHRPKIACFIFSSLRSLSVINESSTFASRIANIIHIPFKLLQIRLSGQVDFLRAFTIFTPYSLLSSHWLWLKHSLKTEKKLTARITRSHLIITSSFLPNNIHSQISLSRDVLWNIHGLSLSIFRNSLWQTDSYRGYLIISPNRTLYYERNSQARGVSRFDCSTSH